MAAEKKKARLEVFPLPMGATSGKTDAEIEKAYKEAIRAHPFHDNCHSVVDVYEDCVLRDGKGTILGVLIRQALPLQVREMAAKLLRPAATKTTLRSSIFGGEAPQSGVAGYFDYRGSPIEFKYRKTAFTHEHINEWPAVFPMVDYVSEIYRRTMPEQWQRQMDAIPDVVRIHNSPFSTLTINSQFRTASHTDAGDFDDGYGCLASLEGDYQGLHLTFDNFHVNYVIRPGDVLVFNTHHFHSNTELELLDNRKWSRLTCVFYYRASLGEPAGYSEYRRRLLNAKQVKKATLFQTIVEKPNGVNLNRAAEVHPISLTPFGLLEAIGNMCHCRPKSRIVHQWLLDVHEATEAGRPEELLFGEVLVNLDGLPARHADDIVRVHSPSYFYKSPAMGGFKDFDEIPATFAEKANFFQVENLSEYINSELVDLWADARCQWLGKVKEEWERMVKRSANRESFMWKNHSDLTSTFFEACEVAKAVFLDLREKESAIPQQEETFWTLFACHLHRATVTELRMPETAITLKKLNVKLKDFNYGGTRYFKDMDDIEQQRRLDRRQRIEEARRAGGAQSRVKQPSEWAKNDTFDYQTEDCVVDYTSLGFATPAENADRAVDVALYCKCANPNAIPDVVEILIVLPRPSAPPRRTTTPAKRTSREPCGAEYSRIMENPAALRILHGSTADGSCVVNDPGASLPPPTIFKKGRLQIHYAYADELPTRRFHFTILQHALIGQPDPEAAKAMIEKCRSFTRGCVFVLESELWCRQHYTIHSTIREAYAEVAEGCYQDLLRARYGVRDAVVRTRPQLRELVPDLSAIYKLRGSPLNSLILLCSTQREENTERQ